MLCRFAAAVSALFLHNLQLLIPETLLKKLVPKLRTFRFLLVDRFGQAAVQDLFHSEKDRVVSELENKAEE